MSEFTELHHAFIVARYYKYLTETFGAQGLQLFIMATQKYAEQRGSRMAQRAIRDGKPLTFATYRAYGEWQGTVVAQNLMGGFENEVMTNAPDYEVHIKQCPWAYQFKTMGMKACGVVYCTHLDKAIARGFNPYLTFDVPQSVNDHDCCIQIMRDVDFKEGQIFEKSPENIKGFDYHCGHVFNAFCDLSQAVFDKRGARICEDVLNDFSQEYGEDMALIVEKFKAVDFNTISF